MASMVNKAKEKLHEHKEKKEEQKEAKQQEQEGANSATATTNQTQSEPSDNEATRSVQIHNDARSAKELGHMEWDPTLAHEATAYAEKLARKGKMEHSGVEGQGENLYMSTGSASLGDAVQSWLDEEKYYKGEKIGEGNFGKWGHFSQCLWHSTSKVGLGKGTSAGGETYIVARYTPQGNMAGEKPFGV